MAVSADSTIVLFADISGSVQLYESLGDTSAKTVVIDLQDNLSKLVVACDGVVHEIIGDELMCCFTQATQAIECASNIHKFMQGYAVTSTPENAQAKSKFNLQMRIGIHAGPAIFERDRMFGDTVNTAARIMGVAQAGQTITTGALLELLPERVQSNAREFDETTLKGKAETMVIYDFPWQHQGLTQIKQVDASTTPTTLQLTYERNSAGSDDSKQKSKTVMIDTIDCPVSIGRAIDSLLVIDSEPVSRRHIQIVFVRGRYVLSDLSTNGTYVYPHKGETIYLRREQIPLWGSGQFCLGAPSGEESNNTIAYSCGSAQLDNQ